MLPPSSYKRSFWETLDTQGRTTLIWGPAVEWICTTQGTAALFIFPTCLVGGSGKGEGFRLQVLEKYPSGVLLLLF